MSNNMKKHFFEFSNEDVNGGESFFLTTDANGTQELTLQSYLNSATFTLGTMPFNPHTNFLGCSKEEFDTACRVSPFKSVLAAKLRLISEINEDEEWAYFDFWHKLMDGDFAEISNGCTASLCFNKATSVQITKHDTDELVAAYTSIFFKEAAQFDFFNNEEIDSIEFEISW